MRLDRDSSARRWNSWTDTPTPASRTGDVVKVDPLTGQGNTMKGAPGYDRYIRYVMKGLNHPTILARRELFERFGQFDERWRVAMDYDWLLRVHQAGIRGVYSADIVATMFGGGYRTPGPTKHSGR